jgi:hypothetical protein
LSGLVAATGRRRARVLAGRTLGEKGAVASLWEFAGLHEDVGGGLTPRSTRRADGALVGEEAVPREHAESGASLGRIPTVGVPTITAIIVLGSSHVVLVVTGFCRGGRGGEEYEEEEEGGGGEAGASPP